MELLQELTLFQRVVITGLDILYNGLFADCQKAIQHHQNILYIKYLWNQGTNKLLPKERENYTLQMYISVKFKIELQMDYTFF